MKKVTITKYDPVTTVEPWVPILESRLCCVRETSRLVDDGTGSGRFISVPTNVREYLYAIITLDNRDRFGTIFPGVTDLAAESLKNNKYDVEIVDKQSPIPKPDLSGINLLNPRSGQLEALSLMCTVRHAIIEAPGGWGKSTLIVQFCRMYPESQIMVVTQQQTVRNQLYERIEESDNKHKVQLVKSGQELDLDSKSVLVLADKSLHRIPDGWGDILIYDEAHNAGSEDTCKSLNRFTGLRTYGMSATPEGRQDGTDLQTKAVLGPILMRIPYQSAVRDKSVVPLNVDVYPVKMNDFGINSVNAKTRICIVRNTKRNKIVSDVVRKVVPADEQLLILVSSTEHVLRLLKFIPEAYPVYRPIPDSRYQWFNNKGLLNEHTPQKLNVDELKQRFLEGKIRVTLSTPIWKEGLNFPNLCYLCNASGIGSPIQSVQVACRLSRVAEGKEDGRLITFSDKFDGLHGRAQKQVKEYRKHGWNVSYKKKLPQGDPLW